ncbi:MAG TPA: GNAT family N-acetyltransferase [Devosiaceae bacterium]|nr:GNAT family N-acetyltransferase [Devosiaceae bacterium]
MVDGAILGGPLARTGAAALDEIGLARSTLPLSVSSTHCIEDVQTIWRGLEAGGIESPGQSYDFIRLWVEARQIAEKDQLYLVASLAGQPVALLPLHRTARAGVKVYSWFPGSHVGCGAPLLDVALFTRLTADERRAFWRGVFGELKGADLVFLGTVPEQVQGIAGLFAELGQSLPVETLYRSAFSSWNDADSTQRTKSRRKHDRQHGDRLAALGKVEFETVTSGEAAAPAVLDEMFRQRARRFEIMGIKDPFAPADIARFYADTVAPASKVRVVLHVLRLDGEIVAVRYNIAFGDRLFCLISSMSDDERIQGGSPGKQCLLRVMQQVFDEGFRVFDMGNGFTDEKRHWCNVQVGLNSHYVPLSAKGSLIVAAHRQWLALRARIKGNEKLLKLVKTARAKLQPRRGETRVTTD